MRALFWLVGLFAAAVALALFMGDNNATVTLFWAPHRIDVSFNLVLAGLLVAFFLVHGALRSAAALLALPQQAHRWRAQQRERTAYAALMDALSHQLAGRFVRARGSARDAAKQLDELSASKETLPRHGQLVVLAHLLAAEACQSLQDGAGRDRHLGLALNPADSDDAATTREGAQLRAVRWALEDRDLEAALQGLAQLPQGAARRTQALRLKLRVARLAHDTRMALDTARLLAKHRAFSPAAARSILRGLCLDSLNDAHDADQVASVWKGLDATDRADPELALAAANRLMRVATAADDDAHSAELARHWLLPVWEAYDGLPLVSRQALVLALDHPASPLSADWLERVERAQHLRPADPLLQYLAAQTFYRQGLWGKATLLFQQAIHGLDDAAMRQRCWCRMAELADKCDDGEAALNCWRLAAMQVFSDPFQQKPS